ncbi:complex I subunit 5 family protein [Halanaerobaculum tunisiense]
MEPIWLLLVPLITAFSLVIFALYSTRLVKIIAVISGGFNLWLAIKTLVQVLEQPQVYQLSGWGLLGINLVVDPLSGLLAVVITFMTWLVIYYSLAYIQQDQRNYYMLLFLLVTGLLGLVITGDLFNLYVFIELTAVTSYALVVFAQKDISIEAGFKYLVLGSISGILLLLAIIVIYQETGSLHLAQLVTASQTMSLVSKRLVLVLLVVGLGTKFALVPLHTWLPDAHPAAPSPISALLSGVVIKAYLYAFLRLLFILFTVSELIAWDLDQILVASGVVTLLTGHLLAYQQQELKRLLAYSSISQIGYLLIGIGLFSTAGLEASIYHLINHALVKGSLFLLAGIFIVKLGTSQLEKLQGVAYQLPITCLLFTISTLNIVGLPPFNIFISKWLLAQAAIEAGFMIPAACILVGSLLSLVYYLQVIRQLYTTSQTEVEARAVSYKLLLPTVALTAVCLVVALVPKLPLAIIQEIPKFLFQPSNYSLLY